MKSTIIAALLASTQAVKITWPSVARCAPGQMSTDEWHCDDNSKGPHNIDNTGRTERTIRATDRDQYMVQTDDVALFDLDGQRIQLGEHWPSVARCAPGQMSTDEWHCDDNSKGPHNIDNTGRTERTTRATDRDQYMVQMDTSDVTLFNLDGLRIQTGEQWPSVARCAPGQMSTDEWHCDDNSKGPHNIDNTGRTERTTRATDRDQYMVQMENDVAYRPPIKCFDPKTENPISCDWNDIDETNSAPMAKKGGLSGLTPVKEVAGGPSIDLFAKKENEEKAEKK